jgi:hypothetical protein
MLWNHHKVGFLDEMFTVFDDHSHPVVLIGDQALRWMAVGVMTNEVHWPALRVDDSQVFNRLH